MRRIVFSLVIGCLFVLGGPGILRADNPHDIHLTHPRGPLLGETNCLVCHLNEIDYSLFADGEPIETTTVCDNCHSPDGTYDGVNDVTIGAKVNWNDPSTIYNGPGTALQIGKEDWCACCHDGGSSVIDGVYAPNVIGDDVVYGYNASGHGRNDSNPIYCDGCHDLTSYHIDGVARSYSALLDNYRLGYRLNERLDVPRSDDLPGQFQLCTQCHAEVLGTSSYFRNDGPPVVYLHLQHLSVFGDDFWDSDWDSTLDSALSCPACHNVHGSPMQIDITLYPNPVMIRHGELISTPGTTDKVPAMDFRWYQADHTTVTADFLESRWGSLLCGTFPSGLEVNHVCAGCHPEGRQDYYRSPPIIDKIRPRPCRNGEVIRIVGSGFGEPQGADSVVHVGSKTYGLGHDKIRLWTDAKIKLKLPKYKCSWFGSKESRRSKNIWVTVNGVDTNKKKTRILRPDRCQ